MEEKLREAACHGDVQAIETIISNGIDVNSKHKMNGWTALHWAARRNNVEAVKVRNLIVLILLYNLLCRTSSFYLSETFIRNIPNFLSRTVL